MILPVISKRMYASDPKQGMKVNVSTLSDGKWLKTKTKVILIWINI